MQWSDIQFDPTDRLLRQFAGIWTVFFAGFAVFEQIVHHRTVAAGVMAVLALTIGPAGLIWPKIVKPIYVAWSVLAFPIGFAVSWIALAILLYGVFTPIGLLFRLFGRDPLMRRRPASRDSYWTPTRPATDPSSYFRQS